MNRSMHKFILPLSHSNKDFFIYYSFAGHAVVAAAFMITELLVFLLVLLETL